MRQAAGDAQSAGVGNVLTHMVEMGHMAENHALHTTPVTNERGYTAYCKNRWSFPAQYYCRRETAKKEVVTGFWQTVYSLIDQIEREFTPLGSKPFEIAGRRWAGFVDDVLPVINIATVDIGISLMIVQTASDPVGDRLGAHYGVEGELPEPLVAVRTCAYERYREAL